MMDSDTSIADPPQSMRNILDSLYHGPSLPSLPKFPPIASPSPFSDRSLQYPPFAALSPSSDEYYPEQPITLSNHIFYLLTISFIGVIFLISQLAFFAIIYLRLISRHLRLLQNFNSLWTIRLLLVSLGCCWAINEILRLPYVGRKSLNPLMPQVTFDQQIRICQIHAVLSLGIFEPAFLITVLNLVNFSLERFNPIAKWCILSVLIFCSPIIILQIIFVYFTPFTSQLRGSTYITIGEFGNIIVRCSYPYDGFLVFVGFTIIYTIAFLASCRRVIATVLNKGIINRIKVLAISVMVLLPVQIVCLIMSWKLEPLETGYGCLAFAMFISVAFCVGTGEVILVLKPVIDALVAVGEFRLLTLDRVMQGSGEGRGQKLGL